jgi:hypothetical protein
VNPPTLFDTLAPVHKTDGAESRRAAARVKAADQFALVLRALANAERPLTDDDLAERCGLIRTSAGTRRGVGVKRGLIVRVGTGTSAMGNPCASWSITAKGLSHVREMRAA